MVIISLIARIAWVVITCVRCTRVCIFLHLLARHEMDTKAAERRAFRHKFGVDAYKFRFSLAAQQYIRPLLLQAESVFHSHPPFTSLIVISMFGEPIRIVALLLLDSPLFGC